MGNQDLEQVPNLEHTNQDIKIDQNQGLAAPGSTMPELGWPSPCHSAAARSSLSLHGEEGTVTPQQHVDAPAAATAGGGDSEVHPTPRALPQPEVPVLVPMDELGASRELARCASMAGGEAYTMDMGVGGGAGIDPSLVAPLPMQTTPSDGLGLPAPEHPEPSSSGAVARPSVLARILAPVEEAARRVAKEVKREARRLKKAPSPPT